MAWAFLIKLKSCVLKPQAKFCSIHLHPACVKSAMVIETKHKANIKSLNPFTGIHYGPDLTSTSHKTFLIAYELWDLQDSIQKVSHKDLKSYVSGLLSSGYN